jgi:hypothetical protein
VWSYCFVHVDFKHFGSGVRDFFLVSSPLKVGQIGCAETSVTSYQPKLRKIPKDRRYHFGSLPQGTYINMPVPVAALSKA